MTTFSNRSRRFFKSSMAVLVVGAALGAGPAHATDVVWDPGVNTTLLTGFSSTTTAIGTVTAELQTILAYLMGTTTGGNGLVETISSINDKLARANADAEQGQQGGDVAARVRESQLIEAKGVIKRVPAADGCAEMTYSGGRGAASTGSAAVKSALDAGVTAKMLGTHDQIGAAAQIVMSRAANNFCTAEDIKTARGGCAAVGTMPGGDVQSSSLTQGAVAAGTATNVSLTTAQQAAAQAVIRNIAAPFPPEASLTKAQEATKNGGQYLSMVYVAAARVGAAADALTSIASVRYANPNLTALSGAASASNDFNTTWSDSTVKAKYSQFFPGQAFPAQPSEWEMLRYEIFSRYADATGADAWQARVASFTEQESLQELARMQAIQLRLSEIQIERQEDTNKMLAALVGQQMQPVTADGLTAAYNAAANTSAK